MQLNVEDDEEETVSFFSKTEIDGKKKAIDLIFLKITSLVSKAKQTRYGTQLPIWKCLELF